MKNDKQTLLLHVARSGLCARREAFDLIKDGKITVNHWPIKDPSYEIKENDAVRFENKLLTPLKPVYLILNKPEGCVTTKADEKGRATVMHLLDAKLQNVVFPVGRLDMGTTGVLLLTNDGELALKLAHPRYDVKKVYVVTVNQDVLPADIDKISRGLYLTDGAARVDDIEQFSQKNKVRITIHSGKNRIVRRIFESLGYTIRYLDRINFSHLTKKGLPVGSWRYLHDDEIRKLLRSASASVAPKTKSFKKTDGSKKKFVNPKYLKKTIEKKEYQPRTNIDYRSRLTTDSRSPKHANTNSSTDSHESKSDTRKSFDSKKPRISRNEKRSERSNIDYRSRSTEDSRSQKYAKPHSSTDSHEPKSDTRKSFDSRKPKKVFDNKRPNRSDKKSDYKSRSSHEIFGSPEDVIKRSEEKAHSQKRTWIIPERSEKQTVSKSKNTQNKTTDYSDKKSKQPGKNKSYDRKKKFQGITGSTERKSSKRRPSTSRPK